MNQVILEVKNLKQYFKIDRNTTIKAVDNVSFKVYEKEIFSVVGESGSGKSTLGRSIIRIYNATDGEVFFLNENISGKLNKAKKKMLRQNMQMIFQDPMASLNPRKKVLDTVAQGLDIHFNYNNKVRKDKVLEVLHSVGLSDDHITRYPHMFSGGQRQRIGVARAIIMNPQFLIADEIISALDVSIQAQVINLMRQIQKEKGLTMMFIAHDLSMVRYISDRVAVMHLGHVVEIGNVQDIYDNPLHPYTKSLLSAIPHPDPKSEKNRKRVIYAKENITYEKGEMQQVSESHFVLATLVELESWKNGNYDDLLLQM